MSALHELYERAQLAIPATLIDWEERVASWHAHYCAPLQATEISEINLDLSVFLFDHVQERVTLAYAISAESSVERDATRMRGFPAVSRPDQGFIADKGHFLGHASGGTLDINLFPQRRELNRGWSKEGKVFREMERYVAKHPGTFFYHRPIYDDVTWIPRMLEYGVLVDNQHWWIKSFNNR